MLSIKVRYGKDILLLNHQKLNFSSLKGMFQKRLMKKFEKELSPVARMMQYIVFWTMTTLGLQVNFQWMKEGK